MNSIDFRAPGYTPEGGPTTIRGINAVGGRPRPVINPHRSGMAPDGAFRRLMVGDRVDVPALRGQYDRVPGGKDDVMHSSVQAWSVGEIFPAVIVVTDHGGDFLSYGFILDGEEEAGYATYADAFAAARHFVQTKARLERIARS